VRQPAGGLPDVAALTRPRPSQDGTAALVTVIPGSAPDSEAAVGLVHALRAIRVGAVAVMSLRTAPLPSPSRYPVDGPYPASVAGSPPR
jgi:hypothetical protein